MKVPDTKEQARITPRVRGITRTAAAGFLLFLFFATACRRSPDSAADHLTGETGWMNEAQAVRIEGQLERLSKERILTLFVQVHEGPPPAQSRGRKEG
ncbi:MAG: hypothetical protein AB1405_14310, partial [Bdellovibrionota bacterium]